MARAVVVLEGLAKSYGAVRALDGLDLTVDEGELVSLLGPSGCGKTTTLNVVAGFVPPDAGRVVIDGTDVTTRPAWQRGLGVVFQSYALFPHMRVAENVAFGLRERRVPRRAIEARVAEALALVQLPGAAGRWPRELSGGMQQRVALARALVIRPRVLLLDEPLAALDRKLREEMRAELRDIQRSVGITTVFITHDQHEALALSDRVAVMHAGRIDQLGTPREIYRHPVSRFVADFIGASSPLPARVVDGRTVELPDGTRLAARPPQAAAPGRTIELLVRPEQVELGGEGTNTLVASVTGVMYLGDHTEVRLRLAGGLRLLATTRGDVHLTEGESVRVRIPPDALVIETPAASDRQAGPSRVGADGTVGPRPPRTAP